jgi:hypothetical protein
MGMFDGLTAAIAEPIMQTMVVDQIKRYAGPRGEGLRIAICLNKDIYQLWVDNADAEGIQGIDQARTWTRRAPTAKNLLTSENVKEWLRCQKCSHLISIIETTPGGNAWLEWTVRRFRDGLWE